MQSAMLRCIHAFKVKMVDRKKFKLLTVRQRITIVIFTILVEVTLRLAATGRSRKTMHLHPWLSQPLNPVGHTSP
ncbi:hypothetical protein FKM82_019229 [Ascaphus truei]